MVEFSLVRDCPPGDEAAWRTLVQEALKGAPLASLRSSTYDGIATEPLYSRAEEASPSRDAQRARLGRSLSGSISPIRRPPTPKFSRT